MSSSASNIGAVSCKTCIAACKGMDIAVGSERERSRERIYLTALHTPSGSNITPLIYTDSGEKMLS